MMTSKLSALVVAGLLAMSASAMTYTPSPASADIITNPGTITQNNWVVTYTNSGTDALVITNVQYKGSTTPYEQIFNRVAIPSIYVDYPMQYDVVDQIGGTDLRHLHKVDVTGGFRLEAEYVFGCANWTPTSFGCYKYLQEYWFYDDGRFKPFMKLYGPGLEGSNGTPHYIVRWYFDTDMVGPTDDGFARYESTGWFKPGTEDKKLDTAPYDALSNDWKMFDYPESGTGTSETVFVDPYSPDFATFWYLRYSGSEFEIPICTPQVTTNCDDPDNHKIGSPQNYDNNAVIQSPTANPPTGQDNVHWYITNIDFGPCSPTAPCYPGGFWKATSFP